MGDIEGISVIQEKMEIRREQGNKRKDGNRKGRGVTKDKMGIGREEG